MKQKFEIDFNKTMSLALSAMMLPIPVTRTWVFPTHVYCGFKVVEQVLRGSAQSHELQRRLLLAHRAFFVAAVGVCEAIPGAAGARADACAGMTAVAAAGIGGAISGALSSVAALG